MSSVNLKSTPYFDDFDENKKFYQILFRPSYPVQARELNSLQTMLQTQISNLGKHQFKNGDKVVDGECFVDVSAKYVKLSGDPEIATNLVENGGIAVGDVSGVMASVITAEASNDTDPSTLILKFTSSCPESNTEDSIVAVKGQTTFTPGESITVTVGSSNTKSVYNFTVATDDDAIGNSSIVTIKSGIYFIYNKFVLVDRQILILEKYSNIPSYKIGLQVDETIVTPEEDESLLDNALGSNNYSAPGAHRYAIDCTLTKIGLDETPDDSFVELVRIRAGEMNKINTVTSSDDAVTVETLARRTYDESGNYVVRDFTYNVSEHRNNDRGPWAIKTKYLLGDIVKSKGNLYVAASAGVSSSSTEDCPKHTSGTQHEGYNTKYIKWKYVSSAPVNNGFYSSKGYVKKINLLSGGSGYTYSPTVSIEFSEEATAAGATCSAVAEAVAYVENGSVVRLELTKTGSDYTSSDLVVKISDPDADAGTPALASAETTVGEEELLALEVGAGKAYVQGYEIETKGSTIVSIRKARTTKSGATPISPKVGKFVYVTNVGNLPQLINNVASTTKLSIFRVMSGVRTSYDVIGTCRVRGIDWYTGEVPGHAAGMHGSMGIYRLYIDEIEWTDDSFVFERDVKSFAYAVPGTSAIYSFSCDVAASKDIESSLTLVSGTLTTDKTVYEETTLEFTDANFLNQLRINDYVYLVDSNSVPYAARVSNITTNTLKLKSFQNLSTGKVVGSTGSINVSEGMTVQLITTTINEPNNATMLFSLSNECVKSITGQPAYYVQKYLSTTPSGNTLTFTLASGEGTFASVDEADNYIVVDIDNAAISSTVTSRMPVYTCEISNSAKTLTVTMEEGTFESNHTFGVMATIVKEVDLTHQKTKSLITDKRQPVINESIAKSSVITLSKYDVVRISSIKMYTNVSWGDEPSESDTAFEDITHRYSLDSGQTDCYYDYGKIKLLSGYSLPSNPIVIEFDYFEHSTSSSADYFTVSSYDTDEVRYDEIPTFNSKSLTDYIDFRQPVDSDHFVSVKRGTEITGIKYDYYVPRVDKVYLDHKGTFGVVEGIPSLNPQAPDLPAMSMNLLDVEVKAYTKSESDITCTLVDNKRYTMRDIGKLETRIKNLEDYTTLSLLEQSTSNLTITDSNDEERYKQGFYVDNFNNSTVEHEENSCYEIDDASTLIRPRRLASNVGLTSYTGTSDTDSFIKRWGENIISLPFNQHISLIDQPLASKIENINPFNVVNYYGNIVINPSSDDWYEINKLEDAVYETKTDDYINALTNSYGVDWSDWSDVSKTLISKKYTGNSDGYDYFDNTYSITQKSVGTYWTKALLESSTEVSRTNYVVNTESITNLRSRYLLVKASGLRPYTVFHPFFDGRDVSYWCTPASKVYVTPLDSKEFDSTCQYVTSDKEVEKYKQARKILTTTNSYWKETTDRSCLDVGEVVYSSAYSNVTSSRHDCTAVVVGKEPLYDESGEIYQYCLRVVNIKNADGTTIPGRYFTDGSYDEDTSAAKGCYGFYEGDKLTGVTSEAVGLVVSSEFNMNHVYDEIVTDAYGNVEFLFWIPDANAIDYNELVGTDQISGSIVWTCGEKELVLTEDSKNMVSWDTSRASGVYSATGTLKTTQDNVISTRSATLSETKVYSTKTDTQTRTTTSVEVQKVRDPLAQTFYIDGSDPALSDGCFLTKVDLFFSTKDDKMPVTIDIRTVENGYPTNTVLPFSVVTKQSKDVNISSETATYTSSTGLTVETPADDTATTFEFAAPVFVKPNTWYAIVAYSDSNDYNAWISEVGKVAVSTNQIINDQPYNGVLFKSQNASTWEASQLEDLKFKLYRAEFDINNAGTAAFRNNQLPHTFLPADGIQTFDGSKYVRIHCASHGFNVGDVVEFIKSEKINDEIYGGTITYTATDHKVVGTLTSFKTYFKEGQTLIGCKDNTEYTIGIIETITDDSNLVVMEDGAYESDLTSVTYKVNDDINGIPLTDFISPSKDLTVSKVHQNYFVIEVDTAAALTGRTTSSQLMMSKNVVYDAIVPTFNVETYSNAASVSYSLTNMTPAAKVYTADIDNEALNEFDSSREVFFNDVNNTAPLKINAVLTSSNPAISPMVDSTRASVILLDNYIDKDMSDLESSVYIDEDATDSPVILNGGNCYVKAISLTSGGSGYVNVPTITFKGGGLVDGSTNHATAHCEITEGAVTRVIIDSAGQGYSSTPSISFSEPESTTGTTATATAIVSSSEWEIGGSVKTLLVPTTTTGSGYTSEDKITVTVTGGGLANGSPSHAQFQAVVEGGQVTGLELIDCGYGYSDVSDIAITISAPSSGTAATASLSSDDFIYDHILTAAGNLPSVRVGNRISLQGFASSSSFADNNGIYVVENVFDYGEKTIYQLNHTLKFTPIVSEYISLVGLVISEDNPQSGSQLSKYITKQIKLKDVSKYLRVMFACRVPEECDLDVYYKAYMDSSQAYDTTPWKLMEVTSPIVKTSMTSTAFTDVEYSVSDLSFDTFVVKIVMKSTNKAAVPLIKQFRAIACV